jgi:hypothetical protein
MKTIMKSGLLTLATLSVAAQAESIVDTILSPLHTASMLITAPSVATSASTILSGAAREAVINAVPDSLELLQGAEASPLFLGAVDMLEQELAVEFLTLEDAAEVILEIASEI